MNREGTMNGFIRIAFALLTIVILAPVTAARAADKVTVGFVGSVSPTHWPMHIGLKKGFYVAENIQPDLIFIQSSGNVLQQLAAGSLDVTLSAGLVDPIYAIDKGAPISIVRLEIQLPPYAINAKPQYKKLEDLKGKTVMIDSRKGITKIYFERMLVPHHVKPSEVDYVYAGATGARFSALQTGAVDATILLPPFSFNAEAAGFSNLGLVADYAKDLPFTGAAVNMNWAGKNPELMRRFFAVHNKSVAFFLDPKNRQESINIMVEVSKQKPDVIAKTYDFLHSRPFLDGSGRVSRTKMGALLTALKGLGDLQGTTDVERYVLPGVAQLSD
jgi:ABC-type nitrate/sulfonate/bicarbonate transport system substrate-binding protein